MGPSMQHIQGFAFAALLGDASVATWGDALFGGNDRAVQGQLNDAHPVFLCSFHCQFWTMVTWGDAIAVVIATLGMCSWRICSASNQPPSVAFAATLDDGTGVTWGGVLNLVVIAGLWESDWYIGNASSLPFWTMDLL